MLESRYPVGVPLVCALLAASLQGCANIQMGGDEFRPTPICEAIVSGNVDRAMQLVKQGGDVNAGSGCALFASAQRGHLELVKLLLDHKADPNPRISGDATVFLGASTPLQSAVSSRKIEMVQMLLERGANPRDDYDAFYWVLSFHNVEMADLLLRHGANANMKYPAERGVYASIEISPRESRGIDVPRRDLEPDRIDDTAKRLQCRISTNPGGSLLFLAAGSGDDRLVKLLIKHGADLNARTFNGTTPLMNAASQQQHGVMTVLMDAGADVKAADRCGRAAADYAVLYPNNPRTRLAPRTKALLEERERK